MPKKDVNFDELEMSLTGALTEVRPSDVFVHNVKHRLRYRPPMEIEYPTPQRDPVTVLGGVLVGSLLAITLARGLYHIFRRS